MAVPKVAGKSAELAGLLDSPEIERLIAELEATRWTGRPGYPIRTMVGLCLAKSLYAIPTWTKTVALVREHWALQRALGCEGSPPSVYAAYRFSEKLRAHGDKLERCIDGVIAGLREKLPSYGRDLAIDASDMPAYANGQRDIGEVEEPKRFSDKDATWGRRSAISTRKGGSFYGYRLHLSACVATGLPISWRVEPANAYEGWQVAPLLDEARRSGAMADTAALDKGYDDAGVHAVCVERDCLPVIPLRKTTGSNAATTSRPGATTASGPSPGRIGSGALPSGDARPGSASPPRPGSRPAACIPDPLQVKALEQQLPQAGGRRARVRTAQARMGATTASGPWTGARPTPCRPDDLDQAGLHALSCAGYVSRSSASSLN